VKQYRRRTDGMRCVLMPGANVQVGWDGADAQPDEQPIHSVRLSPFLIDAEPVSTTAYARFLNSIGHVRDALLLEWFLPSDSDPRAAALPLRRWLGKWRPIKGAERQPMMLVSWFGANAYSLWANRRDWRVYRGESTAPFAVRQTKGRVAEPPADFLHSMLPSEAQWEYAARGASPRRYPWGDKDATDGFACVAQHANGEQYAVDNIPAADVNEPLGLSPFGLHHMSGNVWQWCRDWYAPDFYASSEASLPDAQNSKSTGVRSERGGSWVGPATLARCSYRRGRAPEARGRCLGFRCVGLARDLPGES